MHSSNFLPSTWYQMSDLEAAKYWIIYQTNTILGGTVQWPFSSKTTHEPSSVGRATSVCLGINTAAEQ